MDFWQTFWATMWGALGGAVVAAFAAWLFSLDLRRREHEDRKQEREQDRLDRQTERADERAHQRAAWEAELSARRNEQEEQRAHEYKLRLRQLWEDLLIRLTKDGSLREPQLEVENKQETVATLMTIDVSGHGEDREFLLALKPRFNEWTAHERETDRHRIATILYGWLNGTLTHADAVFALADPEEWDSWILEDESE